MSAGDAAADSLQSPQSALALDHAAKPDSVMHLDPLTVHGASWRATTPSVTTIDMNLARGEYADLGSLLDRESGLLVRSTGGIGGYAEVSVRGSDAKEVQVCLDGIPLSNASGAPVDLGKIPLGLVQDIEVYRGSAPLEFSSLGAAGAIHLRTDLSSDLFAANAEIGSFGMTRGGVLCRKALRVSSHQAALDVQRATNNYSVRYDPTPLDDRDSQVIFAKSNDAFSRYSGLYSYVVVPREGLRLIMGLIGGYFRKGIFSFHYYDKKQHAFYEQKTGAAHGAFEWELRPDFSWQTDVHVTANASRYCDPDGYSSPTRPDSRVFQPLGRLTSIAHWQLHDALIVKPLFFSLFDYYREENAASAANPLRPQAQRMSFGAGIEADIRLTPDVTVTPRYVHRIDIDSSNGLAAGYLISATLAAEKRVSHHPLASFEARWTPLRSVNGFVGGSYATRNPDFWEKFGNNGYFFGNPDLKPEQTLGAETGVRLASKSQKTSSRFAVYARTTSDKIRTVSPASGRFVPMNFARVNTMGAEWDLRVKPWSWLGLSNRSSYVYSVLSDAATPEINGNREPLTPAWENDLDVEFSLGQLALTHRFHYVSPYYRSEWNVDAIALRPVLDATVRWRAFGVWSIVYRLENYLDVRNEDFYRHFKPGRMHFLYMNLSLMQKNNTQKGGVQ